MKLNFDSINVQILDDYNKVKIMSINEESVYIIDKNTNVEEINNNNIKIPNLKENPKNDTNINLLKFLINFLMIQNQ